MTQQNCLRRCQLLLVIIRMKLFLFTVLSLFIHANLTEYCEEFFCINSLTEFGDNSLIEFVSLYSLNYDPEETLYYDGHRPTKIIRNTKDSRYQSRISKINSLEIVSVIIRRIDLQESRESPRLC